MVVHNILTKKDFDEAIAKPGFVIIDCFATWCGPCKVIAPELVKMSDHFIDTRFYKLDVDNLSDVAAELGVRAMPTFFGFKNGEKVGSVVGANKPAIEALIVEHAPKKEEGLTGTE